jgi:hypothetical protein
MVTGCLVLTQLQFGARHFSSLRSVSGYVLVEVCKGMLLVVQHSSSEQCDFDIPAIILSFKVSTMVSCAMPSSATNMSDSLVSLYSE